MARMSVATIDSPEFINLQPLDINPLMSSCEIKVLYTGGNRNGSYITKDVATEMAKTLRGAPIVGWYREEKEDFGDHGERVIFDGDGIKFECLTKPYGFVSPDAKVWFQNFEEKDDFGNTVTREYLMTTGYLWTGQYEEAKLALLDGGHPHSMELDQDSLQGRWTKDINSNIEFFIINDAIFSKLCILGNDVEPCFEGSSISVPNISKTFTKMDDDFKNTLFNMMQELQFALKGGTQMNNNTLEQSVPETKFTQEDTIKQTSETETAESCKAASFTEQDDDDKDEGEAGIEDEDTEDDEDEEGSKSKDNADDEDEKKRYSLLEEKYAALKNQFADLESKYQELVEFKNQVDNEKKDALINQFYMLSEEDKKDVIDNKAKYSLDEIEAKLSVICVRKKVNFDLDEDNQKAEEKLVTTFTLDDTVNNNVPAWVSALRDTHNNRYN